MSISDVISITISAVSAVAAILLAVITFRTMGVSKQIAVDALKLNQNIFQRQNIITLHQYWEGVQMINSVNPDPYAVIKAANALDLTATLWNHEGIEKEILYESYWEPYRQFYDLLNSINSVIREIGRSPNSLLTPSLAAAYQDMLHYGITYKVKQTTLSS